MVIGEIVGNVVSTKKNEKLIGCKFMLVKLNEHQIIVALDNIGAGIGEEVILTMGTNAVLGLKDKELPVDALIIGIVD